MKKILVRIYNVDHAAILINFYGQFIWPFLLFCDKMRLRLGGINMDIEKLFYECIIPEAMNGRINVYDFYNIAFSTNVLEDNKYYECKIDNNEMFIPTLMIKNKEEFNYLLREYVDLAMGFYDDDNFSDDIIDYKAYDNKYMISKEKAILAFLFANATVEDFNDPIAFLRKRINFIRNHHDEHYNLGYSEKLDCDLEINVLKDIINNEGVSQFVVTASDDDRQYTFPKVKFGISDDTVHIYAIQKRKRNMDNLLEKKLNRKLYKVGEGFVDEGTMENPKDVTASFLVVLNMAVSYFNQRGYTKIVVPSILIERWNEKRFSSNLKHSVGIIDDQKKQDFEAEQELIQSNLTNKLMRTFLRLACHYNNLEITALPYESDSALHVVINNEIPVIGNNSLLVETAEMVNRVVKGRNR